MLSIGITKTGNARNLTLPWAVLSKAIACLCVLALSGCTSLSTLFFYPQKTLISTPADAGLDYQDAWLTAADGTQLHAWWIPAQGSTPDSNNMVLYLHGNAENISSHSHSIYWLAKSGVSVLSLDYRGFGASQGRALLPDMLEDLTAAAAWMKNEYPDKDLIVLGQSIGTVLAINFAAQAPAQQHIKALILDAPLTAIGSAARSSLSGNLLGWLVWPFTVFIPNQWDSSKHIDKIDLPVLIMHSPTDSIIPYAQGKKLHSAWQQAYPAQQLCWLDSQGPHIMSFAFPEMRKATLQFIEQPKCQPQTATQNSTSLKR